MKKEEITNDIIEQFVTDMIEINKSPQPDSEVKKNDDNPDIELFIKEMEDINK